MDHVTYLINISGSVVIHPKHRNQPIGGAIGTSNIGPSGSNTVHIESDATGRFGDQSTAFQSIVNAFN